MGNIYEKEKPNSTQYSFHRLLYNLSMLKVKNCNKLLQKFMKSRLRKNCNKLLQKFPFRRASALSRGGITA